MASNVNQQTVTATSWVRAFRIVLENPVDGVPSLSYLEEVVLQMPDGSYVHSSAPGISFSFDPTKTIVLPDGTSTTYGYIATALTCDYIAAATARGPI